MTLERDHQQPLIVGMMARDPALLAVPQIATRAVSMEGYQPHMGYGRTILIT